MKDDIIKRIKEVEIKLKKGVPLEREDNVFLFALSLIKGKDAETKEKS